MNYDELINRIGQTEASQEHLSNTAYQMLMQLSAEELCDVRDQMCPEGTDEEGRRLFNQIIFAKAAEESGMTMKEAKEVLFQVARSKGLDV